MTAGLAWHLSERNSSPISRPVALQLLAQSITHTQTHGWNGFLVVCTDGTHAAVLPELEALTWKPAGCHASRGLIRLTDLEEMAHAITTT